MSTRTGISRHRYDPGRDGPAAVAARRADKRAALDPKDLEQLAATAAKGTTMNIENGLPLTTARDEVRARAALAADAAPAPEVLQLKPGEDFTALAPLAQPAPHYQAIARVMAKLGPIPALGHHDDSDYSYATDDSVCDALRPLMAAEGLVPVVSHEEPKLLEKVPEFKRQILRVVVHCALFHAPSGQMTPSEPWLGEAFHMSDKSGAIAITNAKKAWLTAQFLVSTKQEPKDPARATFIAEIKKLATLNKLEPADLIAYLAEEHGYSGERVSSATTESLKDLADCLKREPDFIRAAAARARAGTGGAA